MADSSKEAEKPKVSKLPLPISDSPLVIDLPDGQKIVVGKLTQGSVIEVATWRGVGRPDSRTSRLMLGVGSGNVNESDEAPAQQTSAPSKPKPQGFAGFVATAKDIALNFNKINWKATIKAFIDSKKKSKPTKPQAPSAENPQSVQRVAEVTPVPTVHRVSEDAEIEEWLNRISERATKSSTKSAPKPAKKAVTTKKAAPKSTNTRAAKK